MQTTFTFALAALASIVAANPAPAVDVKVVTVASGCSAPYNVSYASIDAGSRCITLPSDCTAEYLVQPDDTCDTISEKFGNFTESIFYYWNPYIGLSCLGLQAYVPVCINTPWYTFTAPVQKAAGTIESLDDYPVPMFPYADDDCSEYELVGDGVTIEGMAAQAGVDTSTFMSWNGNQTGVWSGYWVCAKP